MNILYKIKYLWPFAGLCALSICSCKKDKAEDINGLLVYTSNNEGAYNQPSLGLVVQGSQAFGRDNLKIAASVTRPSTVNIEAQFVLDTSLVRAFNENNNTTLLPAPAAAFQLANNGRFTIRQGALVSDSVQVTVVNPQLFTDPRGYVIPLVIKSTNGQDNLISTNRNTYFVTGIIVAGFQLRTAATAPVGTAGKSLRITAAGGTSFESPALTFAAYSNVPLPGTVTLNIEARDELVAAYNTQNGTSFLAVPSGSYNITTGGATINTAGTVSTNFLVNFDATRFTPDTSRRYLLPLALQGSDNSPGTVMYVSIIPALINVNPVNVMPAGQNIDRSRWSASATTNFPAAANVNYTAANVLDGNTGTYWAGSTGLPQSITIDMGQTNTLRGLTYATGTIRLQNIFTINLAPRQITVLTSNDGIFWQEQGVYSGTNSPAGTFNGISFYTPVSARYFRLTCTSAFTTNQIVGFSEINAVN